MQYKCPGCGECFSSDRAVGLGASWKCPHCGDVVVPDLLVSCQQLLFDGDLQAVPIEESHFLSILASCIVAVFWGSVVVTPFIGLIGAVVVGLVTLPLLYFGLPVGLVMSILGYRTRRTEFALATFVVSGLSVLGAFVLWALVSPELFFLRSTFMLAE